MKTLRSFFFLPLLSLCILAGSCVTVEKIPLVDLHPGHRVEVMNLGDQVNSPIDDYAPALDPDAVFLYFSSGRDNQFGIYRVGLDPETLLPAPPGPERVFQSGKLDGSIAFSANGERILFVSCEGGAGDCDIYEVLDFGSDSPKMVGLANVNTRLWESAPALSADGTTLYFAGMIYKTPDLTDIEICVSRLGDNGVWSPPLIVNRPVNSGRDENSPYLAYGDSALFFSSKRPGGRGGYDIYVTYRQQDGGWGPVYNLGPPINTMADERGISMSRDGKVLFFSSDRREKGASGGLDIYMARFVP